jgi:hypothetical protein
MIFLADEQININNKTEKDVRGDHPPGSEAPDSQPVVENTLNSLHKFAHTMERMRFADYTAMMTRPGKILYINFMAGLARGLGFGLGMTVLLGISLYLMGRMMALPVIGGYVAKIAKIVQQELIRNRRF